MGRMDPYAVYTVIAAITAAALGSVLVICLRHVEVPGAKWVAALMVSILGWSFAEWMLAGATEPGTQRLWFYARWVFIPVAAYSMLVAVLATTGRADALTARRLRLLAVVPLSVLVMLMARPAMLVTPIFRVDQGLVSWEPRPGPAWHVAVGALFAYGFAALAAVVAGLGRADRGRRRASALLAIAIGVLVLGQLAVTLMMIPHRPSPLPVALALLRFGLRQLGYLGLGLGFALAVLRYRLLSLPPVAVNILNTLADPVYVIDAARRLLFVNDAFCTLAGAPREALLGAAVPDRLAALTEGVAPKVTDGSGTCELEATAADLDGRPRHYLVRTADQGAGARVGIVRDVTERKRAQAEREAELRALAEARAEVRQLREILPICSYCKKIRNDANAWQQLEHYISVHTGSRFSHGICPECYERRMGEPYTEDP